jgi:hypothetical protein
VQVTPELSMEILFVDTATTWGRPDDGLVLAEEGVEPLMSGMHGLAWRASGLT